MPFTGSNKCITINRAHLIQGIFVAVINRPSGHRRNCSREKINFAEQRESGKSINQQFYISRGRFESNVENMSLYCSIRLNERKFIYWHSSIENVENFTGNFILLGIAQNPFENFRTPLQRRSNQVAASVTQKENVKHDSVWIECAEMINFILDFSWILEAAIWSLKVVSLIEITSIFLATDDVSILN